MSSANPCVRGFHTRLVIPEGTEGMVGGIRCRCRLVRHPWGEEVLAAFEDNRSFMRFEENS